MLSVPLAEICIFRQPKYLRKPASLIRTTYPTILIRKLTLRTLLCFALFLFLLPYSMQGRETFRIIGYYAGPSSKIDSLDADKLTHLIFSFGHLKGNRFHIGRSDDSLTIRKMVALKTAHPNLKVMLSLGGWGGCATCSDVFATDTGRTEFARSVREATDYFGTDGIDLDWEYPAIQGYPGHKFTAADRDHFTALIQAIRKYSSPGFEISFAAGGFTTYIDSSVDWKAVAPLVDFVNIMSYDLTHGYSTVSGHHTPLYSTPQQTESTDHAVKMLLTKGVPAGKLIIGAALYGRYFEITEGATPGLYQPCRFTHSFSWKHVADSISTTNGFISYWDPVAQAPYAINEKRRLLATFDNERSVALKTLYAKENRLGGIMYWQIADDKFRGGLMEVMRFWGE